MKTMFTISGNLCGERIRLGRAMHKPPLTQQGLANKINFLGMEERTKGILAKIEKNNRHVIDAELRIIAKALHVSMEWLVGDTDDPTPKPLNEQ